MLASLVLVFREVLEAGLIVGIVLAATRGIAGRGRFVAGGIAAGVLGAAVVAACAGALSAALEGLGQEVFTAAILLVAAAMLAWHQLWMARHGREMAADMGAMGRRVAAGETSLLAMAVVVAVAVLREGAEVVLFLYGIALGSSAGPGAMVAGGVLGILGGAALSFVVYRGLVAIPVRRMFQVTGWLIALLAAGMAGQAAATLAGADLIPAWGYQLWDTSGLLPEGTLAGRTLKALVGYADRPPGVQVAAWLTVLLLLIVGARVVQGLPGRTRPGPAAPHAAE